MIYLNYRDINQGHIALREAYQVVPQPNADDYLMIDWDSAPDILDNGLQTGLGDGTHDAREHGEPSPQMPVLYADDFFHITRATINIKLYTNNLVYFTSRCRCIGN